MDELGTLRSSSSPSYLKSWGDTYYFSLYCLYPIFSFHMHSIFINLHRSSVIFLVLKRLLADVLHIRLLEFGSSPVIAISFSVPVGM
jgi:hypothetical protein